MKDVGAWLLGIAAAGMLSALAVSLTPQNGRKAVKFAGGLLVILAVLLPLRSIEGYSISSVLASYEDELASRTAAQSSEIGSLAEKITASELESYLSALVKANGAEAKVNAVTIDGVPYSAMFFYSEPVSEALIQKITSQVAEKSGIPAERQRHVGSDEGD